MQLPQPLYSGLLIPLGGDGAALSHLIGAVAHQLFRYGTGHVGPLEIAGRRSPRLTVFTLWTSIDTSSLLSMSLTEKTQAVIIITRRAPQRCLSRFAIFE